jgi:hypothetical protein
MMPWRLAAGLPVIVAVVALVGFQLIHDSPARYFILHKSILLFYLGAVITIIVVFIFSIR